MAERIFETTGSYEEPWSSTFWSNTAHISYPVHGLRATHGSYWGCCCVSGRGDKKWNLLIYVGKITVNPPLDTVTIVSFSNTFSRLSPEQSKCYSDEAI